MSRVKWVILSLIVVFTAGIFISQAFADDLDSLKDQLKKYRKEYLHYASVLLQKEKVVKDLMDRIARKQQVMKSDYDKALAEVQAATKQKTSAGNTYETYIIQCLQLDTEDAVEHVVRKILKSKLVYPEIQGCEKGIAKLANEKAIEYIADKIKSLPEQSQIVVCKGLASVNSKHAIDGLISVLDERDWTVVSAAALALKENYSKRSIPPLIEALEEAEKDENQRLIVDVRNALRSLTGKPGLNYAAEFKSWWEATGKAEIDEKNRPVTGDKGKEGGLSTYLYGEITSKKVIFILDRSDSMNAVGTVPPRSKDGSGQDDRPLTGEKDKKKDVDPREGGVQPGFRGSRYDICKKEFKFILDNIPEDTMFNVIFFNHEVTPCWKKLSKATKKNKKKAWALIDGLKPTMQTNTFGSLEEAFKDRDVDTIYFLTDGMPTFGQPTSPVEICAKIKQMNQARNIRIHCIALLVGKYGAAAPAQPGQPAQPAPAEPKEQMERFLRKLAEENGGTFKMISD